jgi:large subunit ribosomal protein L25
LTGARLGCRHGPAVRVSYFIYEKMKSVALTAFPRAIGRRAGAKKLRESGRIPAVIYGCQAKPQNLEVIAKDMEDLIHHSISENLLVDLAVKNDDPRPQRLALVQEVQHHPLSGKVLHVDFHEIAENEKVIISVPVETTGEPEGVKNQGGVLEHVLFKVRAWGLAKDLPEIITVDVSHLKIGEAIKLGEIKPPPGVEIVGDKHISVIAVAAPRTEEEEAAEAAEAAAAVPGEVEMIKEKKEGEEEGAAPAAKGAAAEKGAAKGAAVAAGKAAPGAAAKGAPAAAGKAAPAAEAKAAPAADKKASEKKK